jgi:hypothetical protein
MRISHKGALAALALVVLTACPQAETPDADTTQPTVTITSPAAGAVVATPSVTVEGGASDDVGVTRVTYQLDGGAEWDVPVTPGPSVEFSFAAERLLAGENTITVYAYDAAGNRGSASVAVRHGAVDDAGLCEIYAPNDSFVQATPLALGSIRAAICQPGGIDIYAFTLGEARLVTLSVAPEARESEISSRLELYDGAQRLVDAAGHDESVRILLPEGRYYLAVSDRLLAEDETFVYTLEFGAEAAAPTFEAAAGTYHAASDFYGGFSGNILAISARNPDGSRLGYKILSHIAIPGVGTFPLTYNAAVHHPLTFFLSDEDGIVAASLRAGGIERLAPEGLVLPQEAVGGDFVFRFPGQEIVRSVDAEAGLAPPEPTATIAEDRTSVTVAFEPVANANHYLATVVSLFTPTYGEEAGAASPITVALDGALEPGELIEVSLRASTVPLFELPLPEAQLDVSEYIAITD